MERSDRAAFVPAERSNGLVIVSPEGVITQNLGGVKFSPDELRRAIERSDSGQLASGDGLTVARCYLYDPTEGKLGAVDCPDARIVDRIGYRYRFRYLPLAKPKNRRRLLDDGIKPSLLTYLNK